MMLPGSWYPYIYRLASLLVSHVSCLVSQSRAIVSAFVFLLDRNKHAYEFVLQVLVAYEYTGTQASSWCWDQVIAMMLINPAGEGQ